MAFKIFRFYFENKHKKVKFNKVSPSVNGRPKCKCIYRFNDKRLTINTGDQ